MRLIMENNELEREYRPYILLNDSTVDRKQDYRLYDGRNQYNKPLYFVRFLNYITKLKKEQMNNVPKKQESTKFNRKDNIGGFTNITVGQHVKITENGGSF